MKKSRILFISALSMLLGMGVVGGASLFKAEKSAVKTKAVSISSKLVVKLGNLGKWSQSSAKLCAYLTDDSSSYWTSLQTLDSEKEMYVFDYTVSFTPTKLIWVRMNPSESSGSWDSGKKWNQTGDLAYQDATYLEDQWDPTTSQCSQWSVTGNVYTSKNSFSAPKVSLGVSSVEIIEGNQPQVHGQVTLDKDEEFKLLKAADNTWSAYYGCPAALNSCFSGGSKEGTEGDNIKCLVAGTYDFYFNTETKRTWISRQDIVDADGYASYFLSNVGCDESGKTLPSGWSTCATQYGKLSDDAKDYLYAAKGSIAEGADNVARCVYWYDYAVAAHPSLDKFMKNHSGTSRASAYVMPSMPSDVESSDMMVVVTVAAISLAALSCILLVLKKKRRQ